MSKQVKTIQRKGKSPVAIKSANKVKWDFPLDKSNMIFAAIGLASILLGYALMATGIGDGPALPDGKWNNFLVINISPLLLVTGYCILIPIAIMKSFKFGKSSREEIPQQEN